MDRIDVVVVDDHPIYRDGLVAGLSTQADFRVVGEFASVEELDARVVVRPRVAVVDLGLPGVRGRHAVAHVRAAHECGVLVVSSAGFRSSVLAAMAAGARGYLTKRARSEELFRAVRRVSGGRDGHGDTGSHGFPRPGGQRCSVVVALDRLLVPALAHLHAGLGGDGQPLTGGLHGHRGRPVRTGRIGSCGLSPDPAGARKRCGQFHPRPSVEAGRRTLR